MVEMVTETTFYLTGIILQKSSPSLTKISNNSIFDASKRIFMELQRIELKLTVVDK